MFNDRFALCDIFNIYVILHARHVVHSSAIFFFIFFIIIFFNDATQHYEIILNVRQCL